ncbi:hypothetical protein [Glycomyces sp. NPDC048151]|uniref:hypothetical protein n=1 Tax=Glycomyces sp. NPDC048151 TaxID=3364002 RepID=UPI0037159430
MRPSYPRNTGRRLLTAAAAAALGAGAFALPAAAQDAEPVIDVAIENPIYFDGEFSDFSASIDFGDGFDPAGKDVAVTLEFVGTLNGDFEFDAGAEEGCTLGQTSAMTCPKVPTGPVTEFAFQYRAADVVPVGQYPYRVEFALNGETVAETSGTMEVDSEPVGSEEPFLYDTTQIELDPGETAGVDPGYYQDGALPSDTEALAFSFTGSSYILTGAVTAAAEYDNCVDGGSGSSVTCVVTDFEDVPGGVFVPSPVDYTLDAEIPGSFEVCGCEFAVRPLDAETLASEFGDLSWDEGSDRLFATTLADPDGNPDHFDDTGYIDVRSTGQLYDLSVGKANASGAKNTETTVKVKVGNGGPAGAIAFFDGPGSYALFGTLPTGLDLVKVSGDGWNCLDKADWASYLSQVDPAKLEKLDFVCFFSSLADDKSLTLDVKVKVTSTAKASDGSLEVVALEHDEYPGQFDSDLKNNKAEFTVNATGNGSSTPKLPKTGTSLGMIVGGAALVLVVGVVLMVVTARRRKAGAEE